jgi:hypothetical protein
MRFYLQVFKRQSPCNYFINTCDIHIFCLSQQILHHRSRGSLICQNKQVTMQRTFAFTANRSLATQSIRCNKYVAVRRSFAGTRLTTAITNGTKCKAFFNFGNNNNDSKCLPELFTSLNKYLHAIKICDLVIPLHPTFNFPHTII